MTPMSSLLLVLAIVAVVAILVSAAFRRLGLAGEGIVAGVLVGVLAGPTVTGRLAPDLWTTAVIGANDARSVLERAISERQAFAMAAGGAALDAETTADGLAERDSAIETLRIDAAAAITAHARPWSIATTTLAVVSFWLGWATTRRSRRDPLDAGPATVAALGCWVAFLPAFAAIVLFRVLGRGPTDPAVITVAACVAIAGWPPAGGDARRLERLGVRSLAMGSMIVASILAAMIALAARLLGGPGWALVALPLAVFSLGPAPRTILARGRGRRLLHGIALPVLAAWAVLRSEVLLETPWIATIGLLLIAGDGRAFGWLFGLRFCGLSRSTGEPDGTDAADDALPPPTPGWTTALLASGAGGAQLAFAAIAVAAGAIDTGIGFALVLAAAGIDLFGPARRRLADGA